jgi:DNA invertase Pin-like site-specific DNA recombinase
MGTNMNRIYLRVSTEDSQEFDRQIFILEKAGYDLSQCVIYEEKVSGKSTKNRNELKKLLSDVEENDKVIITEISRLARSVIDLWEIANQIVAKKGNLVSIKENIDLETAAGRLMFTMLGGMAQFERDTISERTCDALNAKKKSGVKLGRPKTISDDVLDQAVNEYMNSKLSYLDVSNKYNISNVTLFNEFKKRGLNRKRTRNVKKEN